MKARNVDGVCNEDGSEKMGLGKAVGHSNSCCSQRFTF